MADLTLKRMDAAIRRIFDWPLKDEVSPEERLIFLAGMKAAQAIEHPDHAPISPLLASRWDYGHAAHQAAIRATVARLRKEAKANG